MDSWKSRLCSEIEPRPVEWLWPGYLARGKLALLDGDPEMGKSLITLDLIARLTRGGPLPDGTPVARPHRCAILSTEDDDADTVRPRAEAAGVDLARLVVPDFDGRTPRLPDDLAALERLIAERGLDLVVLDPMMAFLPPAVAANVDQCVRQALTPLSILAARTGCTILLIRHLAKRLLDQAIRRGQGSMAIVAAVRTALFVAPHPGIQVTGLLGEPTVPPSERVLAVSKGNLSRRPRALGYRIVGSPTGGPVVEWTGPVDLTADDLCREPPPPTGEEPLRMRDRAVDWLRRELANGPRPAGELFAAAAEAGIPDRTLQRAKGDLFAQSQRHHDHAAGRAEWYWYDPAAPWPADAPFQKLRPGELPPLFD
jgi:hypothetical protein